jgi:hypothetical protein
MNLTRPRLDERGIALPMAMMLLLLLTSLMIAFAVLSKSEPVIAANHLRVTQARALAETGFERAIWALSQGVINAASPPTGALVEPLPDPAPAPYDGSVFVPAGNQGTGGFVVTVTTPDPAGKPNERLIDATGWTPTNDATDTRTKAHRRIRAIAEKFPNLGLNAPCALCVRGDVAIGGNALVDATTDMYSSCGKKYGTSSAGSLTRSGSADVKGAVDGPSNTIAISNEVGDYQTGVNPSEFDNKMTLSPDSLNLLRNRAKANGTYFGPGYPNGGTTPQSSPAWTGSVTFNSGNRVGNGIVFVDTVSGNEIPTDPAQQNASDFANVSISGNPFLGTAAEPGIFKGWIVVNGSLAISGNMKIDGLAYVVNDLTYNGTGTGEIRGLVISQNVRDVDSTTIASDDSTTTGNSRIKFDCSNVQDYDPFPRGFGLKAGTYREVSD